MNPDWVWDDVVTSGVCYADIATAAALGKGTVFPLTSGPMSPSLLAQLGLGSFPKDDSGEALFEVSDQSPRRLGGNPWTRSPTAPSPCPRPRPRSCWQAL